ncbi:MAG TPA: hypothetical protein VLX44_00960 [Xanthobacteraceae bacterium]|nr:hypothetical protein [Xanthobacteraceae bacterium]
MRPAYSASLLVAAALISLLPAAAQMPRPGQLPPPGPAAQPRPAPGGPPPVQGQAPVKPYKPLAVAMPAPSNDPSFDAFRKQLADVANRKDRAGLARLIVSQGFFWDAANGDKADKRKPAVANLEQALGGFAGPGAQGWEALASAASDPTLEPLPDHKGVMCGPAGPNIDDQAFEALTKETGTDAGDWAFPVAPQVDVRGAAQPNAPVIEKLGMTLVRVLPDQMPPPNAPNAQPPMFAHVVLPSGRTGYVAMEQISPIGFDQICYLKDASGWKITGYESTD